MWFPVTWDGGVSAFLRLLLPIAGDFPFALACGERTFRVRLFFSGTSASDTPEALFECA